MIESPEFKITRIETADSHVSPGEPRRIFYDHRWWPVDQVVDRWYEGSTDPERPFVLYFKVLSGGTYFLTRYLSYFKRWQVASLEEESEE